ncbi:MAG: hypothetical protein U0R49_06340 [Fimbriimonadales bacterium]
MPKRNLLLAIVGLAIVAFAVWMGIIKRGRDATESAALEAALADAEKAGLYMSLDRLPNYPDSNDASKAWRTIEEQRPPPRPNRRRSNQQRSVDISKSLSRTPPSDQDWAQIEQQLRDSAAQIAAYEKACEISEWKPSRNYADGASMLIPEFTPIGQAFRAFSARAVVLDRAGKFDEALKDLFRIRKLVDQVATDPLLMGPAVSAGGCRTLCRTIERIANNHANDAKALSALLPLVSETKTQDLKIAYATEFAVLRDVINQVRSGKAELSQFIEGAQPGSTEEEAAVLEAAKTVSANCNVLETLIAKHLAEISKVAGKGESLGALGDSIMKQAYNSRKIPGHAAAAVILRGVLVSDVSIGNAADMLDITRFCLTAAIEKLSGRPVAIEQIRKVSRLRETDRYSSAPFKITFGADKILVYSVGRDLKDDGGKFNEGVLTAKDDRASFLLVFNDP